MFTSTANIKTPPISLNIPKPYDKRRKKNSNNDLANGQ